VGAGAAALSAAGHVETAGSLVRFIRPGLVEEYSTGMDGIRQDFLVLDRPAALSLPVRDGRSVEGGVRLTYGELWADALRYAAALREHGVRPVVPDRGERGG
jgi:hypothetical protein